MEINKDVVELEIIEASHVSPEMLCNSLSCA